MRFPFSPYPVGEFVSMVARRFSAAPPRPDDFDGDLVLGEDEPDRWIGFVGDVCPLFGREALFEESLRWFLAPCDLLVGNFEGVVSDWPWLPYRMKHEIGIFEALEDLHPLDGWVLSVANNHAADYGPKALERTLKAMEARGVRWLGTANRPRLAVEDSLTFTAWTWWSNRPTEAVAREALDAPARPGTHVALPHWGYEHERQPRSSQQAPPGYALTAGHHSHLPQPVERLGDDRIVAWSLGSFVTGKRLAVLGEGAVLKIGLASRGDVPGIMRASFCAIDLDRSDPRFCRVRLAGR